MKTKWKGLFALLLALLIQTAAVYAAPQEESSGGSSQEQEQPTQEEGLERIMNSNPEDAQEPNFTRPEIADAAYYKDFEYFA